MKPKDLPLLELLYDALRSERGTEVETSDVELLRQRLYKIRGEHKDEFECLSLVPCPTNPGRKLWIVKRNLDAAPD